MLWEEDDDEIYDVLEAAATDGVEVFDLCEGMKKIELGAEPDAAAASEGADAAPEPGDEGGYTEASLAAMSDTEIEALCDEFKLDPENYDTWDDARAAILAAASGGGSASDFPTAAEVEDWDFDQLKAFATENEVEIPPKSRTSGYRKAVLEFIEQANAQAAALADDEQEFENGEPLGELQQGEALLEGVDYSERFDALEGMLAKIQTSLANFDREVVNALTGIRESLNGNAAKASAAPAERPPGTTVKKAATPTKAAPRKAVAATKAAPAKKAGGASPRVVGRR